MQESLNILSRYQGFYISVNEFITEMLANISARVSTIYKQDYRIIQSIKALYL